jgi:hypothetical protein
MVNRITRCFLALGFTAWAAITIAFMLAGAAVLTVGRVLS